MIGMDAHTGKRLDGLAHLQQSIADIIMTTIGTVPMHRDYGSLVPLLIDHAANEQNRVLLYGATAQSIHRHEKRVQVRRIALTQGDTPSQQVLIIDGFRTDLPGKAEPVRLSIPITGQM